MPFFVKLCFWLFVVTTVAFFVFFGCEVARA